MGNASENRSDNPERKLSSDTGSQTTPSELAINDSQSLSNLTKILRNTDFANTDSADKFLPSADSVIALGFEDNSIRSRGVEGYAQAWANGEIPPIGGHPSESVQVQWPPGYDPREHVGESFGKPEQILVGNPPHLESINVADVPPWKDKHGKIHHNYWNCLLNPHIDANGRLVGTPGHVERDKNGKITKIETSNTHVSCENHFPKPKQQTAQT